MMIRFNHKYIFDKDDIFFGFIMHPENDKVIIEDSEIKNYKWVKINEIPEFSKNNPIAIPL